MNAETRKTLHHLFTQAARLLGIDNGSLRVDFAGGEPKQVQPTPTIRFDEKERPGGEQVDQRRGP